MLARSCEVFNQSGRLRRSTDDGRSIFRSSYDAGLVGEVAELQWLDDKAVMLATLKVKDEELQGLRQERDERQVERDQSRAQHLDSSVSLKYLQPSHLPPHLYSW